MIGSPLVYVIILNYNSTKDTIECAYNVAQSSYQNTKYLIIDNNSRDSKENILANKFSSNEFIQLAKNIGYAGGNNIGFRHAIAANADYIFIINPDVRIPRESIQHYVDYMEKKPNVHALNPIQLGPNSKEIDSFFKNQMFTKQGLEFQNIDDLQSQSWEVDTLFGAAIFFRTDTIKQVGGFDPLYFAYWEEVDLCRRIKRQGGKLAVIGNSPIVHLRNYEPGREQKFRRYLRLKGQFLYAMKNQDLSAFNACIKGIMLSAKSVIRAIKNKDDVLTSLRVFLWVVVHIPYILLHRAKEEQPGAYL